MSAISNNFFQNALQGLNFAQSALNITSNNIANSADTTYSREVAVKVDSAGTGSGSTIIGQRQSNFYLSQNVWSAQTYSATQGSYSALASQLNQMLGSSSTSSSSGSTTSDIGGAIRTFFSSVNAMATAPADSSARQTILSNAGIVSSQFSNIGNQIATLADSVNQNISGDVGQINSLASQIATVNGQLQQYQGGALASPPNTLLDQRDSLIQKLSKLVQVSVLPQQDGSYSVFMGMGQPLVLGSSSETIKTVPSISTPGNLDLAYSGPTGQMSIPNNEIVGGDLGALMQFRSQTLEPTARQLGLLAMSVGSNVNQQLSLGRDLSGQAGSPMFALPLLPSTAITGSGSLAVQLSNPSDAVASDYDFQVGGSGQYTVTRLSDGTRFSATQQADGSYNIQKLPNGTTSSSPLLQIDGLTFTPSSVNAGDSFIAQPYAKTMGGLKVVMTDPTRIAAASGPLGVKPSASNTGSGTLNIAGITGADMTAVLPKSQSMTVTNTGSISKPSYTLSYQDASGQTVSTSLPAPVNGLITVDSTMTGGTTGTSLSLRIEGGVAGGDSFTLAPSAFGTGDVTNSTALYNLQNATLLSSGQSSFNDYYSAITSNVGLVGSQYSSTSAAASGVLQAANNSMQQLSGVNLDEEAANLLTEQRQYQAAAKVITISDQLFQSLLQV